jgi:hypothetical protein
MLPTRLAEVLGSNVGMGTSRLITDYSHIINENGETTALF